MLGLLLRVLVSLLEWLASEAERCGLAELVLLLLLLWVSAVIKGRLLSLSLAVGVSRGLDRREGDIVQHLHRLVARLHRQVLNILLAVWHRSLLLILAGWLLVLLLVIALTTIVEVLLVILR